MAPAPIKLAHAEMNSRQVSTPVYYIFNTTDGFVIVAGDDRAQEILGYGEGTIDDVNALPANMRFWLDYYKAQIEYLQAHPDLVVDNTLTKASRGVSVEPLITAKWDQGYPFYAQCPMDGDVRAQTDCAATSLAQIFYKWKYPVCIICFC